MNKPVVSTNLCLIRKGDLVLLAMKKRGFGEGKWNGYGGKVLPGETMEECLVREVKEESGLTIGNFKKVGFLTFDNADRIVDMDVFEAFDFTGELVETEEMAPRWFSKEDLPWKEMWPSDPLWYPYFFEGKSFKGEVIFDENHTILHADIKEAGI
jgi:8-oxo-dGTP pyrophosphatase MutT (NUDIX family)